MTGHLPVSGDVRRAMDAMNRRVEAAMNLPEGTPFQRIDVGKTKIGPSGISGEGGDAMRRVHGDLLDMAEFVNEVGLGFASECVREIAHGTSDPVSVMVSLAVHSAALGALMERLRWEQDR